MILADAHPASTSYRATEPTRHQRAVVWQYAPAAWAMATGADDATSDAVDRANLQLAQAIRPGTTPVQVPFTLPYLPPGLAGQSARIFYDSTYQLGTVALGDGAPAGAPPSSGMWGSAMEITAWTGHAPLVGEAGCPLQPRQVTLETDTLCFLNDHVPTIGLLIDRHGLTVRLLLDPATRASTPTQNWCTSSTR